MPKIKNLKELAVLRDSVSKNLESFSSIITMCAGTGCRACDCMTVVDALQEEIKKQGLTEQVYLRTTGCHGYCEQAPLLIIEPGNILYVGVKPENAQEIIERTIKGGECIEDLLYSDPATGEKIQQEKNIPFYASQDRVLLDTNTKIAPKKIEEYISLGGYEALGKALEKMTPEDLIEEIKLSGLRGRGGGGYPAGRKWEQCKNATGAEHYVICNADEGDPGAFMDGAVLEGNPHAILEGMILGAYAIGSSHGFVYVRNEYPLAVLHVKEAIKQAIDYGLMGDNILGSDFSFNVKVVRGGGAFVCGESTALMLSLEGKVGEPRAKDVHTVEHGYLDQPTVLNNVETWANIPMIIKNGADWFASKGTEGSKGTKIFALTGQVKNTGLVEVEMGATVQHIVFDIGGGPKGKHAIKAVQTGGPSGGCIPLSKFDLPVDFDALYEAGSMMGSGGMVVIDESACMVDVAKYFLNFLHDESCGKCVTCRIGIDRMLEIINNISKGKATEEDLDLLEDLAWTVSQASLCALGKTSPNPVLSTLKYFREEYDAHINEKRCPAGVCPELIRYEINPENCTNCGLCAKNCPHNAISGDRESAYIINDEVCSKCGICAEICKLNAICVI